MRTWLLPLRSNAPIKINAYYLHVRSFVLPSLIFSARIFRKNLSTNLLKFTPTKHPWLNRPNKCTHFYTLNETFFTAGLTRLFIADIDSFELLTRRKLAIIVIDALLSTGKDSCANHAKLGFITNTQISLTRCIKTFRELYGSVRIVQKIIQQRTHRNYIIHEICGWNSVHCQGEPYRLAWVCKFSWQKHTNHSWVTPRQWRSDQKQKRRKKKITVIGIKNCKSVSNWVVFHNR